MRTKQILLPLFLILAAEDAQLAAQQLPLSAIRTLTDAHIIKRIEELDAADFRARERASRELLDLKGLAIGPLKKALAGQPPLEQKLRAERVLKQLAIYAPGGEVVNGLNCA